MAIELSLDTVDELAQDNYSDIVIPLPDGKAITLLHPLRMKDQDLDALTSYFKEIGEEAEGSGEDSDEDSDEPENEEAKQTMLEQLQGLLRIIVKEDAEDLFSVIGTDLTRYQTITTFYFEQVTPGEA